nr:hypothetical protein CFP56_70787 [Quercus suber]
MHRPRNVPSFGTFVMSTKCQGTFVARTPHEKLLSMPSTNETRSRHLQVLRVDVKSAVHASRKPACFIDEPPLSGTFPINREAGKIQPRRWYGKMEDLTRIVPESTLFSTTIRRYAQHRSGWVNGMQAGYLDSAVDYCVSMSVCCGGASTCSTKRRKSIVRRPMSRRLLCWNPVVPVQPVQAGGSTFPLCHEWKKDQASISATLSIGLMPGYPVQDTCARSANLLAMAHGDALRDNITISITTFSAVAKTGRLSNDRKAGPRCADLRLSRVRRSQIRLLLDAKQGWSSVVTRIRSILISPRLGSLPEICMNPMMIGGTAAPTWGDLAR